MKLKLLVAGIALASFATAQAETYGPYPITLKGYSGDKTNSVSYSGQVARHVLHNSLKKIIGKGDGSAPEMQRKKLLAYYSGKDAGRAIIDPKTKDDFVIKQTKVDEISKGKELKGKTYKGAVAGFPGNMTGPEVVDFLLAKAAAQKGGFDPVTGYDYGQIISKFLMGAVFYNQAVDNYLDEKLSAEKNPNNKPYKDGAYYTGKEHVWDEAFGYFGAPAHAMNLSPKEAYGLAKKKGLAKADANKDGVVDLKSEMTFAHAYYAADADKSGKTQYLKEITAAFINGRKLISSAKGEALSNAQRTKLMAYANTIKTNWEKVLAEATFKYAGSVYKDLKTMKSDKDGVNAEKDFRKYAKHWGELKGFAMAMQTSGKNLGETAVKLNRLIGYGPVLFGGGQVTGINDKGQYTIGGKMTMDEYMVHMVKVQKLLADEFNLKGKKNDVTAELAGLIEAMGESKSIEND